MFNKSTIRALVLTVGAITMQANAALIPTNWKNAGDGLATLDTETGLEWLDLSLTAKNSLETLANRLTSDLAGWRMATQTEVNQLHLSYSTDLYSTTTKYFGTTNSQLNPWRSLFGVTGSENASQGVYLRDDGNWGAIGAYRSGLPRWSTMGYSMTLAEMKYSINVWSGYFLVSDGGTTLSSQIDPTLNINNPNAPINQSSPPSDVSVQAGLGMSGLLLMILGLLRRRQV